ncbi:MAG: NAD(P)H-dependent oxidoreductase subunit E [Bacteroidia bacterium]|nr:NAD(P)H-dependent oxidoreductase subunit E [Bacteroidia bacterium]NNF30102.1 NADP oxidoreductase [Flavobacteriaceae bacterium]MBT8274980.1 NAD(P)H-dependent oxidoreductase subunit E [Bacteroidia bacterium]NNJ80600.1 NADP oxidoreductase [Flavobacteriaceae bacterium]NNK55535.1 NADP oxidoreductase [Flavobacteriaceae bacterium]
MITENKVDRSKLMDVIWDIQRKKFQITHDDISKIAQEFDMSRMELEGIVTFYHFYHRTPCGKYTIYLNDSIVSEHSGRPEVLHAFEEALGIKLGRITADGTFGLFKTPCIGLSDQEPSCLINFKPFTNLTPEKVRDIIGRLRNGEKPSKICDKPKTNIRYTPEPERTVFFKPYTTYSSLDKLNEYEPSEVIELVKKSKLTGRGGAFFPTGLKWQFCSQNEADIRYIICNADEGEPGTFKDRVLLQEHPELLIEGMILAAYAIGCSQGAIYLRAEYMYLKKELESLLEEYRNNGYLGKDIKAKKPFDFDIYIHMGAGAYVCGEETALIHSMEGKRGEPSTKEYFPVEKGFNGKPTVVNNVETLCAVPRILNMGLDKYLTLGTEQTPGTKLLSVSGDCGKPGLYEIEWGMKLREFLKLIEARNTKFILFNGYAGECLSEADFDREISGKNLLADDDLLHFKDTEEYTQKMSGKGLRAGGSVMIFNKGRDLLHVLKNVADFFVAESCGICVPCRTGNFLLNKKIDRIKLGHGEEKDLEEIKEWSKIIKTTSRCGLGKMSSTALNDAIFKFPEVFGTILSENTDFNKAFNLDDATIDYDHIINEMTSDYD